MSTKDDVVAPAPKDSATEKLSQEATHAERFVADVRRRFMAEMGTGPSWSDYQASLAQHMFLKVDMVLKDMEAKRLDRGQDQRTAFKWTTVNLEKLAMDSVHRINLGLDALIPNHVHIVPYWNKRLEVYDLDLRVGYVGEDLIRRELATDKPIDIVYELVYDSDKFVPLKRSNRHPVETYEFEITKPFDRGEVVGGFGYIMYDDERKNKVVLVAPRDFNKARDAAKTGDFWGQAKWEQEMQLKTVVRRTTAKIPIDPRKVNAASYAYVEAQEIEDAEAVIEAEIEEAANGEILTLAPSKPDSPEQHEKHEQNAVASDNEKAVAKESPQQQNIGGPEW